ncbi:hypothetical protein [Paludibaculum fermentans]|uniref:Glycosyltransferase RgtA/B/C/D-like domain-containing protein n=1 Tax=Paludibaculum fermentans TaxID=1473598 RepID=A0A7S7NM50_PALFE|nr:hypothetical protein [Paludibaculum fermentans]QOY86135.1 hypothetical protein IRI77_25440 [Paludibaculum fermentans]
MTPKALAWRIFFTCWIVYTVYWAPWIIREQFPALSLAEEGTLNVARFDGFIEDIFRGPHGGAYINNNPGASIAGALPLLLGRPLLHQAIEWEKHLPTPRIRTDEKAEVIAARQGLLAYLLVAAFLTVAGVMAPVSALAAALLARRLAEAGIETTYAATAALTLAFGTPVFFRTLYLNHNLLVGHLGLFVALLLWNRTWTRNRLLLAGLLSGYAVLCDFTGLLLAGIAGLYLLTTRWQSAIPFTLGTLPGVLGLAAYQALSFGNPLLPSQHYMPPTGPTSQGYRGFSWPSPDLAWANFFHPSFGLFAYCPLLLLACAAPFVQSGKWRVPAVLAKWIYAYFAAFVLFCAANQYSWLQWNTGMRYLVPVVPGLLLLSLQVLQTWPRWLAWTLLALSAAHSWSIAASYELHALKAPLAILTNGPSLAWLDRLRYMGWATQSFWLPFALAFTSVVFLMLVWYPKRRRA